MSKLELVNVPDEIVESLQRDASQTGRDLNSEAIECLRRGIQNRTRARKDVDEIISELRRFRSSLGPNARIDDDMIRRARDEGRA